MKLRQSIGAVSVTFTIFENVKARRADLVDMTLSQVTTEVEQVRGAKKADLPLLALATFGSRRSSMGSLRHDANVVSITGVVIDYDGGQVPFDSAVSHLREAGISAIVYETASSKPEAPRWRVLAFLSQPHSPKAHGSLVARLNGLLGGIAAAESFALSQAYYYGSLAGASANRATFIEGTPIDERPDLDVTAIGRPAPPRRGPSQNLERYLARQVDWAFVFGCVTLERLCQLESRLFSRVEADLARNGKLANRWKGNDGLRDPTRSGHDKSLVQILRSMKYSITEAIAVAVAFGGSHPQLGRGLDDLDKAYRNVDLERYWVRCWSRDDEDLIPGEIADLEPAPKPQRDDAASFPEQCRTAPGKVGEIIAYLKRASTRDLPIEVLVPATLAAMALAAQNRFAVGDERLSTPIHVYAIIVAQTGIGKSELGKLIVKLMDPQAATLGIVENLSSGPALLARLHRIRAKSAFGPTMLYLSDEFGLKLQSRVSKSGHTHAKDIIDEIISAYGKGNDVYSGKAYADSRKDIDPIERPSVNVLGFTTEPPLALAITAADKEIGFANRFLLFWIPNALAPQKAYATIDQTIPDGLAEFLHLIGSRSLQFQPKAEKPSETKTKLELLRAAVGSHGPFLMPLSTAATKWLDHLTVETNDLEAKAGDAASLWKRARQQVLTVAGILAIGEIAIAEPKVPAVQERHLKWAWDLVYWTTSRWVEFFRGKVSSNEEDEAMKAIEELLRRVRDYAPGGPKANRANYGNAKNNALMCDRGWMPHSLIGRELGRRFRSDVLKRALAALVENEEVVRQEISGATQGDRMITAYRWASMG
jgi:hypothetical protein